MGNVTGFKEKDFEAKDADGDGEISEEERKNWNDKVDKDNKDNGGANGEKDITKPDWDKDGDGKPDPGFELDCWRCGGKEPQCQDGAPGACTDSTCRSGERCMDHPETFADRSMMCHQCLPQDSALDNCQTRGYLDDKACDGQCPASACVPIDVDKDSGKIIPANQTRVRGTTMPCFMCLNQENVKEDYVSLPNEYVILIVETPFTRFILGQNQPASFKPSAVMALAKAQNGKIANLAGDLKSVADFTGGFNIGYGPLGLASMGTISMDQLTSSLGAGLKSSGSYGANCFSDVEQEADKKAPESEKAKTDKGKKVKEETSKEQIKAADKSGTPAINGPIVACGNEDKNKVLKIYDSTGALIDTVTQAMFKADPSIITKKLGAAQHVVDTLIQKSGFDFAAYVQKFTGIPLKDMQSVAAQIAQAKSQVDQVVGKKKPKKKVKMEEAIIPNDPLYMVPEAQKKKVKRKVHIKNVVGLLGGAAGLSAGGGDPMEDDKDLAALIPDQYALHRIGFTPMNDLNSAWNVIDATQKNIVVAVIDSGLDMSHEDAPLYIWTNPKEIAGNGKDDDGNGFVDDIHGWNFLNNNHDFTDVKGHGTFVAGIIAAKQNNGKGISGINPGAVIMPIKVANDEGETDNFAIFRGINYAVNHGAQVLNISLGGRTISKLEQQAIDRAHAMGRLVVVAAGNNNDDMMTFGPSSSRHVLSVGEIDYSGTRSTASNWGPNLGLVAPGEHIFSLCSKDNKHVLPSVRKFGYYALNGTSFSTPMVSATASLIWAKNPRLTNVQVTDIILQTATDMDETGWDGMTGAGVLNAAKALRAEVSDKAVVLITNLRYNRDYKDKLISVDVFGSVRGSFKEYTIEASKGKRPGRFTKIAGPFREQASYEYLARLVIQDVLRGSDDWWIQIRAVDNAGQEHTAKIPMTFPK
jgi:subtilisin family serine protease